MSTPTLPTMRGSRLYGADGVEIVHPRGLLPLRVLGVGGRYVDARGVTMIVTEIRDEVDARGSGFQVVVSRSV